MTLEKKLDELNNRIRQTEHLIESIYNRPFIFEHFEWKRIGQGNKVRWSLFYKDQPLLANSVENRLEAIAKIEGLITVAESQRDSLIVKINAALAGDEI